VVLTVESTDQNSLVELVAFANLADLYPYPGMIRAGADSSLPKPVHSLDLLRIL
jgi:hypothetical protein